MSLPIPEFYTGRSQHGQPAADGILAVHDVWKTFENPLGETVGIKGMTFHVQAGEFVFVVGITGHGKSTLLKLLRGSLKPDKGGVTLGGINIANFDTNSWRRRVGMVAQSMDTLPRLTVAENIALPLQFLRMNPQYIERRVDELLNVFGLKHARDRLCDDDNGLSGGEQQRLAIARAIAHGPDILLCDEPTGNLDARTTLGVMRTLNRVSMLGTTVVCVTHDPAVVNLMNKRVIVVHEGTVASDSVGGYRLS